MRGTWFELLRNQVVVVSFLVLHKCRKLVYIFWGRGVYLINFLVFLKSALAGTHHSFIFILQHHRTFESSSVSCSFFLIPDCLFFAGADPKNISGQTRKRVSRGAKPTKIAKNHQKPPEFQWFFHFSRFLGAQRGQPFTPLVLWSLSWVIFDVFSIITSIQSNSQDPHHSIQKQWLKGHTHT